MRAPRPWLALVLSVLAPGMGHVYLWQIGRGVIAWLATGLSGAACIAIILNASNPALMALGLAVFAAMYIAQAVYAWRSARAIGVAERLPRSHLALAIVPYYVASAMTSNAAQDWAMRNVAEGYRIPSAAMEPTVYDGDWLFVRRVNDSVTRGALVVYRASGGEYLKRVIGIAGDTLSMRNRVVYLNGNRLTERYAQYVGTDPVPQASTWGPLVVPPRRVFIMGDNRNSSSDSRYVGPIDVDSVVGRPLRIYFSRDAATSRIRWERIGRSF